MIYSFADFKIEYEGLYEQMRKLCLDYEAEGTPDFTLKLTEADIEAEKQLADGVYSNGYIETIAFYRKLADWLPQNNAFVLHSALFDVDGTGIAFAAHSGTGKTTHMRLWKKLLGERLTVVNGDKPIVRFFEGESTAYGYGTPWCGKERMGTNTKTQVKHICFIERAEENSCAPMEPSEAVDFIFNQVYMPKDPMSTLATMQLINRLINSCSLWKIRCNMDITAAETAYNKIFGIK